MIHEALVEENVSLDKVYIIPIPNSENNSIWLQHLKSMVPKFNVLYTGNAFVKGLVIGDENVQIKNPDFLEEGKYNGTHIRTCIVSNKNWKISSKFCLSYDQPHGWYKQSKDAL